MHSTEVHKTFFWFPSLSIFLYIVGNIYIVGDRSYWIIIAAICFNKEHPNFRFSKEALLVLFFRLSAKRTFFKKVLSIVSVIAVTDFLFPLYLFPQRWVYYSAMTNVSEMTYTKKKKKKKTLEIKCKQIVAQMETWFYS